CVSRGPDVSALVRGVEVERTVDRVLPELGDRPNVGARLDGTAGLSLLGLLDVVPGGTPPGGGRLARRATLALVVEVLEERLPQLHGTFQPLLEPAVELLLRGAGWHSEEVRERAVEDGARGLIELP